VLLHWPHSEPVGGLELEVIRPIEARGKTFEVGERFPYRDLEIGYENARRLCQEGSLKLAKLQIVAMRPLEVGPVVYAPGDLVPIEVLGTDPVRIRGLEITNHIRVGLDLVPDGASAKKGRSPRKG